MNERPWIPKRKSVRLPAYDYSRPEIYYVTMVSKNRECIFGDVVDGQMKINDHGWAVQTCWLDLMNHYANIHLDEFVIMPNHFHGIIEIVGERAVGARFIAPCASMRNDSSGGVTGRHNQMGTNSLGEMIRYFKGRTTYEINRTISQGAINRAPTANRFPTEGSVWQRNYYERIIRNDDELSRTQEYIKNNPANWDKDEDNLQKPQALSLTI